jgi:hypothetical protein
VNEGQKNEDENAFRCREEMCFPLKGNNERNLFNVGGTRNQSTGFRTKITHNAVVGARITRRGVVRIHKECEY